MNTRIIISLGGSIIIPKTGFDPVFLKSFRKTIESEIAKGRTFVLIVGGGATARQYQEALTQTHKVSNEDLDWMGIATTKVNAEFVRLLFRDVAYSKVLHNPTEKVRTSKPLIIASGWKPGNSTDLVAVQFAKTYGATHVINLSNIEYVYDKDPAVFSDAKKIETIGWKEFQTLVGTSWRPGSNLPFDPIATKEARRLNLQVRIVRGTSLKDVRHAITGKSFVGTTIG
jgi:uridylate kinase